MPDPTAHELSDRHRAVLREALLLVAERGYHGASLRELARRVGVSQPSLYHYFRSKEELVEQLLEQMARMMMDHGDIPAPATLESVPRLLAEGVQHLYEQTDWGLYVSFLFAVSLSDQRWRHRFKDLFVDRGAAAIHALMRPFVDRGEIGAEDAEHLARMVMNAVGLFMIEQTIVYPGQAAPDPAAYVDFVARFTTDALGTLRRP